MKVLDANILLYALNQDATQHAVCRAWLEAALNSEEIIALPWQTLLAFVRISTNSKVFKQPIQNTQACEIVSGWLSRPNVKVVGAGERFWEILRSQIAEAQVSGPLISDAALAALAIEHGADLVSVDKNSAVLEACGSSTRRSRPARKHAQLAVLLPVAEHPWACP